MMVDRTNNASCSSSLIHPGFNDFFRWVNGKLNPKEAKQKGYSELFIKTNGLVLNTTKTIWPLYLPLQVIGLFSVRVAKLAKAFYGVCWSIVYTSLRPFAPDRKTLGGDKASPFVKEAYNLNEHFRLGMGTVVSALYGGGAFGMLWGGLTGDDEFFDKSAKVYSTGMLNQNQIFGSMNLEKLLSRKFNNNIEQLPAKVDQEQTGVKEKMEFVDAVLFIPNIIARALDTTRLFGAKLGEGPQRCINALGKFSYGTWACRFSELKKKKSKEEDGSEYGGDLEPLNQDLEGKALVLDKALHNTQKKSAKVFQILLPVLSWASSVLELLGHHELAEKVFKWEGILERLHPTIAAWCIRNPILNFFKKTEQKVQDNQQEKRKQSEEKTATQVDKKEEPVILKFVPRLGIVRKNGEKVEVAFNTSNLGSGLPSRRQILKDEELGYLFEVEEEKIVKPVGEGTKVAGTKLKDEEWGGIEVLQQAEDEERRRTMIKDEEWGYDLVAKAAQVARKFSGRNYASEKIAS